MSQKHDDSKSWFERLSQLLLREPQDREQLVNFLRDAEQRNLVDANTLSMLEGVITFSELQVRDIMIPRSQMITLSNEANLSDTFETVIKSAHSRFPVTGSSKDDVLGILHAKDLLRYRLDDEKNFNLTDILRKPTFVPESKRLDILLTEFRRNRIHMALVVDEYGGVAGFVTIEDVIEQIVGDIEDEFDIDEEAYIKHHRNGKVMVKAHMPIEEFNEQLLLSIPPDNYDTIGGVLIHAFGYLPKRGDSITINEVDFKIVNADNRRIKLIECTIPTTIV